MAQTFQAVYVQEGESLDYTPGADVPAGKVVVIGSRVGITKVPIEANRLGALATCGVFKVVKVNGAINDGDMVYWNTTANPQGGVAGTGAATTNSANAYAIGRAIAAAAVNDETVLVKFDHAVITNTVHNPLTSLIADPGNAGAIPVTNSGSVQIVTAGAETRTLAVPTVVGQMLAISMKTDGGDAVITVAAAFNAAGNTTITLNDAGDTVVLVGIEIGGNKRWKLISNDGAALG